MSYPKVDAGEAVMPEMTGYKMSCCDCALVHNIDFKVVKVAGNTGDTIHTVTPEDADSLRVVITTDRDEEETERRRAERGFTDDPGLDALILNLVGLYPMVAICHAINRSAPGLREILARGTNILDDSK